MPIPATDIEWGISQLPLHSERQASQECSFASSVENPPILTRSGWNYQRAVSSLYRRTTLWQFSLNITKRPTHPWKPTEPTDIVPPSLITCVYWLVSIRGFLLIPYQVQENLLKSYFQHHWTTWRFLGVSHFRLLHMPRDLHSCVWVPLSF